MKKVIFVAVVLGLLLGCKKENVEPVETKELKPTTASNNPSFVQKKVYTITYGSKNFTRHERIYFKYFDDGMLKNVISLTSYDSLKWDTLVVADYNYKNGRFSLIKAMWYFDPHSVDHDSLYAERKTITSSFLFKEEKLNSAIEAVNNTKNTEYKFFYENSLLKSLIVDEDSFGLMNEQNDPEYNFYDRYSYNNSNGLWYKSGSYYDFESSKDKFINSVFLAKEHRFQNEVWAYISFGSAMAMPFQSPLNYAFGEPSKSLQQSVYTAYLFGVGEEYEYTFNADNSLTSFESWYIEVYGTQSQKKYKRSEVKIIY